MTDYRYTIICRQYSVQPSHHIASVSGDNHKDLYLDIVIVLMLRCNNNKKTTKGSVLRYLEMIIKFWIQTLDTNNFNDEYDSNSTLFTGVASDIEDQ